MNEDYVIDVQGLTKKYGDKTVVDHINLRVPRGKIYGFLGPNGSGKTTSIRMICGLLTPDAGEGTCLGYDLRKQSELIKRNTGYMTQKFSFWEDLTVKENLRFVAEMFSLDHPNQRVENTMEKMHLTSKANQLAGTLSGGWKQRMALAACILHEPKLLLLDEPTAGVDPKARREFWDEIHHLADEGLTILVSTHYMDEAERCHSIIYIAYGKLIVEGNVHEVTAKTGLTTWVARGANTMQFMDSLKNNPAVATIAPFGEALHISGTNADALEKAIAPLRNISGYTWTKEHPSLEDAFIHYMNLNNSGEDQ